MWNPGSWNPTQKDGGVFAKVILKHEHSFYVDLLASRRMGAK